MTFYASASTTGSINVQCHWCHVMLMLTVTSDQKNHAAPHFNSLDLRVALMSVMTP